MSYEQTCSQCGRPIVLADTVIPDDSDGFQHYRPSPCWDDYIARKRDEDKE